MARLSKWNEKDRKKLLKMLEEGEPEQEIRDQLSKDGKPMTSPQFAQQLRQAMVEAGQIKQAATRKAVSEPKAYEVTAKGRLTVPDFQEITGYAPGTTFTLEKPRGRSNAWRLVPTE